MLCSSVLLLAGALFIIPTWGTSSPTTGVPSRAPSAVPSAAPTVAPTGCANNVRSFEFTQLGSSAKLRLNPKCDPNQWVTFEIKDIIETNQNKMPNLVGGTWTSTAVDYTDAKGTNFPAKKFVYDVTKTVGGSSTRVLFTVWLFFQRSEVFVNQEERLIIDQNSIKYDLEFPGGWPFADAANKLAVTIIAHEKSGSTSGSTSSSSGKSVTTKFGGFLVMTSPDLYHSYPSGTKTECAACVAVANPTAKGSNLESVLTFDSWAVGDRMVYDPALTTQFSTGGNPATNGTSGTSPGVRGTPSVACSVFFLLVGSLAMVW